MFSQNLLRCNRGKFVDDSCMTCILRTLYEFALRTPNALKHDTHLATSYFSTKKGNLQ